MTKALLIIAAWALISGVAFCDSSLDGAKNGRKASTSASPVPPMTDRAVELIPGAIPPHVLYVFAPNTAVNQAAESLRQALVSNSDKVCGGSLFLQPGAWKILCKDSELGKKKATSIKVIDPASLKASGIKRAMLAESLRDQAEISRAFSSVKELVNSDGGFQIRALSTEEMKQWWPYISFNVEEPVFVVSTKGAKYRFVFGFVDDLKVYVIDELNTLTRKGLTRR
jgi:hypothetical protein